ncbi:MAG: NAD(P)-binding protein [Planctomycetaceae bacterium]
MKSVAIIGAGLSGLTLANRLQNRAEVTVFEKSGGFGGRMATRHAYLHFGLPAPTAADTSESMSLFGDK